LNLSERTARIASRLVIRHERRVGKDWWPDAVELYVRGQNANAIAKKLGLFRGSVVHALKTAGLWENVPR
jgi:hypothetical protein